jgi:hypothetical protein
MTVPGDRGHGEPPVTLDRRLQGDLDALDEFARELSRRGGTARTPAALERINANAESVEEGLAKLVLALVDLLRQLLEKQAIRRMEAGSLSDEQIERMGETFLKLEEKMAELKAAFGLEGEDLTLNLGPVRDLLAD